MIHLCKIKTDTRGTARSIIQHTAHDINSMSTTIEMMKSRETATVWRYYRLFESLILYIYQQMSKFIHLCKLEK